MIQEASELETQDSPLAGLRERDDRPSLLHKSVKFLDFINDQIFNAKAGTL
jgi:hypothetical protein